MIAIPAFESAHLEAFGIGSDPRKHHASAAPSTNRCIKSSCEMKLTHATPPEGEPIEFTKAAPVPPLR